MKPDPLAFDVGAVELDGGDHRVMAPLLEPEGKADIGVYVSERAEGGDNDALTHITVLLRTSSPDSGKKSGASARIGEFGSRLSPTTMPQGIYSTAV